MTRPQELWWRQARSDYAVFVHLRDEGFHECHLLHYLQMATEKVSKAYLWRNHRPPAKSHTGLIQFMRTILDRHTELDRIALLFGFGRRLDFIRWNYGVQNLAFALQQIAPAEAGDGPNPEYPWPHLAPANSPATHSFHLWNQLTGTGQGQRLLSFIDRAVIHFDQYA